MNIIRGIWKSYLGNIFLKLFPLFTFPSLNNLTFRLMGYRLHKSVRIFSSARILGDLEVIIGKHTFIGHETLIMGGDSRVTIGENCDISSRVCIISGSHHIDMLNVRSAGNNVGLDITIKDGVWVGFGTLILPGVTIGEKAIIGGGSVVSKDIPAYTIAVGSPCRPIKKWNFKLNIFEEVI